MLMVLESVQVSVEVASVSTPSKHQHRQELVRAAPSQTNITHHRSNPCNLIEEDTGLVPVLHEQRGHEQSRRRGETREPTEPLGECLVDGAKSGRERLGFTRRTEEGDGRQPQRNRVSQEAPSFVQSPMKLLVIAPEDLRVRRYSRAKEPFGTALTTLYRYRAHWVLAETKPASTHPKPKEELRWRHPLCIRTFEIWLAGTSHELVFEDPKSVLIRVRHSS